MSKLPDSIEKTLISREINSVEDARFCRAFRYALKEMLVNNAFAKFRLKDIEALLRGEEIDE